MTSWRTTRPRLAPIESRMPISRWRAFARASMTFDALAHAATSTRPNAANTGERNAMPVSVMRVGVACAWSCARTVSTRPATRVSNGSIASDPSTCCGVMPRLSRPVTRSRRDWCAGDEILLAADAVHRERRPQIPRRVVEADEFGSHDADDDELSAVGVDLAAEHRRVTAEEPRPAPVGQHGHGLSAGRASIVWHQASPERDTRGERREVVPGYEPDGHRLPIRLDRSRRLGNDVVEEVWPRAHRLEIAPAEGVTAGLLRVPPDGVEAVRIVHGEGAQDVSVENRRRRPSRGPCRRPALEPWWRQRPGSVGGRARRSEDRARPARARGTGASHGSARGHG